MNAKLRALACCAALAWSPVGADPSALGLVPLHDAVPSLTLQSAEDGATLRNADLAGSLVLLHFWASWCAPCREELPALQALAAALPPGQVRVLLVAIDEDAETSEVLAFARSLGVELPVYVARAGQVPPAFWSWGVPATYVIDARGQFIGRALGPRPWAAPAAIEALRSLALAANAAVDIIEP